MDTKKDVMQLLEGMSLENVDHLIALLHNYRANQLGKKAEEEGKTLTYEECVSFLKAKAVVHLRKMGVPQNILGYKYLRYALVAVAQDSTLVNAITKMLYPSVAKEFGTTPSRVERAMRHAIEVAWDRGDLDTLNEYFGCTVSHIKGKPTNSEFIATIGNMMADELEEHCAK